MNKKFNKKGLMLIVFIGLVIIGYSVIAQVTSDDFKYRNDYVAVDSAYNGDIKYITIEGSITIYKKSYFDKQVSTWDFIGYIAPLHVRGFENSEANYFKTNNKASYRAKSGQFFVQVKYINIPLKNFGTIKYIESGS